MCVATLTLIGVGLAAGGAVMGGIQQGQAASYQAKVASNNAVIERQNAAYSASAGASQAQQSGLQERSKLAALRAGTAANGIDVNSGSAADVQESERQIGRLDTATVSNNSALAAYGYQSKATGQDSQASIDRSEANWDPITGVVRGTGIALSNPTVDAAASSLISSGPSVPSSYAWMQNNSITGAAPSTDGSFSL